jgi:hypothetical protein
MLYFDIYTRIREKYNIVVDVLFFLVFALHLLIQVYVFYVLCCVVCCVRMNETKRKQLYFGFDGGEKYV